MKKLLIGMLVIFTAFLFKITPAYAISTQAGDKASGDLTISSDTVINDNLAAAGNNVIVKGIIDDDLYVAGANITIEGEIKGTLFAAGANITITGKVDKDAFIAGNMITISDKASIGRDLLVAGSSVAIDGPVGRNVWAGSAQLNINNTIGGNVNAGAAAINLDDLAKINGNLTYSNDKELDINKSQVSGGVEFKKVETKEAAQKGFQALALTWIIGILQSLFVGLILVFLMPKWLKHVAKTNADNLLKNLGIGLLVLIVTPIIALISLITIIGMPLAFVIAGLYALMIYLSKFWVAYWIGNMIGKEKYSPVLTITIGILILELIFLIPIVSPFVQFLVLIAGLGAIYTANIFKAAK